MIKILILGGGFGGIRCTLELNKKLRDRKDVQITLVDRNNAQVFQPSLYEVASAYGISRSDPYYQKLKTTVSVSYAEIFKGTKIETIQAEIANADLDKKIVRTNGGAELNFDYLVIALGSEASTFGIEGVSEYAYKFKTLDDAMKLFEDIEQTYSDLISQHRMPRDFGHAMSKDEGGGQTQIAPLKFLIGGAGFNGIELASELSRCAEHVVHKHKINLKQCSDITLIEAMPQILPMVSEKERVLAKARLQKLGINILETAAIEKVLDKNRLQLKNGQELTADFIVWTAGVKAPEILKFIVGLELDKSGKIITNKHLQCGTHGNIFGVGDSVTFIDPGNNKPIPQMAFVAIEEGKIVAENISRLINNSKKFQEYKPSYNFWVAPMGGKYALAHIGRFRVTGKLGYLIREGIDLRYFLSVLPFRKALRLVGHRLSVFLKND